MDYFNSIYKRRLNRYGLDYQSRIQNQREENFERYLLKTVYRVDFIYEDRAVAGSLERYKQDETETLQYLLIPIEIEIPIGTVLEIEKKNGKIQHWLIYYLEEIHASGYNRYIVLRMTHNITWKGRDKNYHNTWCYLYGQENNMLKDEIRSRSRSNTIYAENLKSSFLIMPVNGNINKDDYFEIGKDELKEAYRVTGYDRQSTPGIEYVTVDPIYFYDNSPNPTPEEGDNEEDYYWIKEE